MNFYLMIFHTPLPSLPPFVITYFVRYAKWNQPDPPVTRNDLEEMEILANAMLGTFHDYRNCKA
ncbi:hypothetical protein [Bacillus aerius]|uniref:hypothetical protein n=1 Tax=Bacillus aerius TaxID=293388 RepID=UPI003593DB90